MSRFGTSAINPHPSTSQMWASRSTDIRLLQVVMGTSPTHPPGTLCSKSAHPDVQVHQWFGVKAASLPTDRRHTRGLALSIPYWMSVLRTLSHSWVWNWASVPWLIRHKSTPTEPSAYGNNKRGHQRLNPFRHPKQVCTQGLTPRSPSYYFPAEPFQLPFM